jgi:hypothetical protein
VNRKRIFLILSATLAFCIALGGFLFWFLGGEGDAVKKSATQFAAAVEKYDPGAAPEGGGDYVEGIRAYYGPVAGARFVDSYKKNDNGGPNTGDDRSYWVAQVLLRTERGAAVVEVEYDNNGLDPSNQDLQRIYELRPGDLPDSLGAGDRAEVERAFASRGGQAADSIKLSGAFAHLPKPGSTVDPAPDVEDTPVPPANDEFARQQREAMKQLRCVRKAKGDVEKLRECVP